MTDHPDELDILNMSPAEILRDMARIIQENNLKDLGLTPEDIQTGQYFLTCPRCGDRFWAEDGCTCETPL